MSYRDLRNLCEILRAVGYPRLVSIENFRSPNFPLVADISRWLVLQYEPKADILSSCDTEMERVALVRTFAEFMLINVQVKLNTKRLYQADGYSVKELLKVASVLYNAVREAESSYSSTKRIIEPDHTRVDVKELKETRSLTSSLVKKGVTLYDMLSKEVSLREARQQALSKAYEHAEVERLIKSAIETGGQEAKKLSSIIDTVQNNLASVDGKVEKKKSELERSQKRLLTLKKVRPAFMDEYEELQQELALGYQEYVHRFRVLAYLQNQIEDMDRLEQERKTEERLTKAELSRKAGGDDLLSYGNGRNVFLNSSDDDDGSSDDVSIKIVPPPTIQPNNSSRSGVARLDKVQRRVFGGMDAKGAVDDSEEESDMILVDGDNENTTDDDEEELVAIQKDGSKMGRTGAHHNTNRIDAKNKLNGFNNNDEHVSNGGGSANGGKGYPVDTGNRSIMNRPITGGRKPPTTATTSDDDEF